MIDTTPVIEAVLAFIIAVLVYLTNYYRKKAIELRRQMRDTGRDRGRRPDRVKGPGPGTG